MLIRKKINVYFNNKGEISTTNLTIPNKAIKLLKIGTDLEDRKVDLEIVDKQIVIKKDKNGKHEITVQEHNENYNLFRITLTKEYADILDIEKKGAEVIIDCNDQRMIIMGEGNKVGKIITVKVNKGGVGKTFLSVQTGAGLALNQKKVLLLTSDSQNNILDYTFPPDKIPGFKDGLKAWVAGREGEKIKIRKNLDFIPLENSIFGSHFLQELPKFLMKMREEYDYIIIDSIPTMKLDSVFVECSDRIIVPAFCDRVTVEGALNVIDEAGVEKVHSIIVNQYRNTATQNMFLEKLKTALEGTDIIFPKAIPELSQIETLLEKGKTIWESKSKAIECVQDSIIDIIAEL